MSEVRRAQTTRLQAGSVLADMLDACRRYASDWGHRPERVEVPADQLDRLSVELGMPTLSFPDIAILERKLGGLYDQGQPIKIELRAHDTIRARGRTVIEPPKKPSKLIIPRRGTYGRFGI